MCANRSILNEATEQVANAIVINVEERCRCNFTRSNITSDRSLCFPKSDFNAVTYRGDIHETDTANVFDLINHIEEWTACGDVLIRVQNVFVKVDNSCRVAIESIRLHTAYKILREGMLCYYILNRL